MWAFRGLATGSTNILPSGRHDTGQIRMGIGRVRLFSILRATSLRPLVRHTIGFPRELIGEDGQRLLPQPDVVVIDQEGDGNVFLHRMTRAGEFGGDTWHRSIDEAKEQAAFEYRNLLGGWQPIPDETADAIGFAVEAVRKGD
jgi:hypothetical protein